MFNLEATLRSKQLFGSKSLQSSSPQHASRPPSISPPLHFTLLTPCTFTNIPPLNHPNHPLTHFQTLRYLSSPTSCLTQPTSTYSAASFHALLTRLSKYNLTKSEVLMIFNLRPKDAMALDVIVEEADDRFSEEEQEEILNAVGDVLGRVPEKKEGEDGEE